MIARASLALTLALAGWLAVLLTRSGDALEHHRTDGVFLALGLVILAVGAFLARRDVRRAHALEDRARFRPATIERGRVVLDDEAESYVLSDHDAPPGRVLVRQRERAAADYRSARTVDVADIVRVDPAIVRDLSEIRAAGSRRLAFVLAVVCATTAGGEAATTWVQESHVLD